MKKFDIKIVRIYDRFGFMITDLKTGKAICYSEITYEDEKDAKREAIEKSYSL